MTFDEELLRAVQDTCSQLCRAGKILATAESCSGGLLAAVLTSQPSCGECFHQGFITYTKAAKNRALGISKAFLDTHGTISEETAKLMASGAMTAAKADVGVAITGVAGPDPAEGFPVGVVFIGFARNEMRAARKMDFGNTTRDDVRRKSTLAALQMVRDLL